MLLLVPLKVLSIICFLEVLLSQITRLVERNLQRDALNHLIISFLESLLGIVTRHKFDKSDIVLALSRLLHGYRLYLGVLTKYLHQVFFCESLRKVLNKKSTPLHVSLPIDLLIMFLLLVLGLVEVIANVQFFRWVFVILFSIKLLNGFLSGLTTFFRVYRVIETYKSILSMLVRLQFA